MSEKYQASHSEISAKKKIALRQRRQLPFDGAASCFWYFFLQPVSNFNRSFDFVAHIALCLT